MIQNVLQAIGGIAVYGILSVCLFFVVFGIAMFWAFRMKRSHLEAMSLLPVDDGDRRVRRGGGPDSGTSGAGRQKGDRHE